MDNTGGLSVARKIVMQGQKVPGKSSKHHLKLSSLYLRIAMGPWDY